MTDQLDQLLHLAGVLGADAAWLVRGPTEATFVYDLEDDGEEVTLVERHGRTGSETVFVARFPGTADAGPGVQELKLPPHADREIQVAALLSTTLDALTQIGPRATIRVIEWAFARYGIRPTPFEALERRPARPTPAMGATTRLELPPDEQTKRRGRPKKASET